MGVRGVLAFVPVWFTYSLSFARIVESGEGRLKYVVFFCVSRKEEAQVLTYINSIYEGGLACAAKLQTYRRLHNKGSGDCKTSHTQYII